MPHSASAPTAFVYEAPLGGDLYVQEGGFANVGLDANTGRQVKGGTQQIPLDEADDVLAAAMAYFGKEEDEDWVELPAFRLTIELMEMPRP